MISITIDLDGLGCRSIKVKIIRLTAEHQTAVTAVEQVDQDAFESKPVHLTRVAGERGQFVDSKGDIAPSNLRNVAQRTEEVSIWHFFHVFVLR